MQTITQSEVFQVNSDIPWQDASPGITRQVYGYDDKIMMVKVKFEKGAVGSMHQHIHSQASYVESGSFELTIGDEKRILNTGDGFFVPSNLMHGSVCLEAGVLIDVFSPLREDFLVTEPV
jgi:quercetin dioxygenase-like cupin family protein